MKNWIILIFTLFIITACNKEETRVGVLITGTIIDPNTGEIVEDVLVTIAEQSIENGAYNSNYNSIDTTTSDAFGNYQFELTRKNTLGYELTYEKEGYFPVTIEKSVDEIETKGETIIDVDFHTQSSVLFHFKNVGTTNSGDIFIFNKRTGITECEGCCENGSIEYPGADVDVAYYCAAHGGSFMVYEYSASSDNGYVYIRDSVFCTAQDTAYVTIEY